MQNAPRGHSAILLTFIKVPFSIKTFVLSILSGRLRQVLLYDPTDSDFILDFGKLPFSSHLGNYIIKNGKISTKIHEIGKIKAIFGLGMTPI